MKYTKYSQYAATLAAMRCMDVEELESTYGDMIRDMYDEGISVDEADKLLDADDEEYSR